MALPIHTIVDSPLLKVTAKPNIAPGRSYGEAPVNNNDEVKTARAKGISKEIVS